ncbi:hypothetical protein, partial [Pseudonocardia sp. Ae505_Ps2]
SSASRRALIQLSGNEIRRLLAALAFTPLTCIDHVMHWSTWRRERQQQARDCHYRRRGERPPS